MYSIKMSARFFTRHTRQVDCTLFPPQSGKNAYYTKCNINKSFLNLHKSSLNLHKSFLKSHKAP